MISVWHDIGSDGAEELEGSNEFQMFRTSYAGGDKNASGPKRTQKNRSWMLSLFLAAL
jgi:hypothetical protein